MVRREINNFINLTADSELERENQREVDSLEVREENDDVSIEQRHESYDRSEFGDVFKYISEDFNLDQELRDYILTIVQNPDNYLNRGAAGEVFTIGDGLCIKVMRMSKIEELRKEFPINDPEVEARIQIDVEDLTYESAYIPTIFAAGQGQEVAFIIMQEINGVNLNDVYLGKAELPEGFVYRDFFEDLFELVFKMHRELGISHGDIARRNIMVDEHGNPVLIDFGLAKKFDDYGVDSYAEKDKDEKLLDNVYMEIGDFLGEE